MNLMIYSFFFSISASLDRHDHKIQNSSPLSLPAYTQRTQISTMLSEAGMGDHIYLFCIPCQSYSSLFTEHLIYTTTCTKAPYCIGRCGPRAHWASTLTGGKGMYHKCTSKWFRGLVTLCLGFQDVILLPITENLNNSGLKEQKWIFHTQQEIRVNRDLFFHAEKYKYKIQGRCNSSWVTPEPRLSL